MDKTAKGLAMIAGIIFVMVGTASAATLNVPTDYPHIRDALRAANPGDIVLVGPGKYIESIRLKSGVAVISAGGPELTTIQGDTYYVVYGANDSTISGFTITGIMGVYNYRASPVITNNKITGNYTGVSSYRSAPIIANNKITGNRMYGIWCVYLNPTVTNNVIADNRWGIANIETGSIITNNTLVGNNGAGIFNTNSRPAITNNVIVGNETGIDNGGSSSEITYNDIWGNSTNIRSIGPALYSDNISENPLFVNYLDLELPDDYHLQPGSLCIDAGSNDALGLSEIDADGNPRIVDGDGDEIATVDIGAYEFRESVSEPEPDEILLGMIKRIEDEALHRGIGQSLTRKLEGAVAKVFAAAEAVSAGKPKLAANMYRAAKQKILAFINEVEAQSGKKITVEFATILIEDARELEALLEDIMTQ